MPCKEVPCLKKLMHCFGGMQLKWGKIVLLCYCLWRTKKLWFPYRTAAAHTITCPFDDKLVVGVASSGKVSEPPGNSMRNPAKFPARSPSMLGKGTSKSSGEEQRRFGRDLE